MPPKPIDNMTIQEWISLDSPAQTNALGLYDDDMIAWYDSLERVSAFGTCDEWEKDDDN